MPRGLMDDLEGEVIGEEIHEGGFENSLGVKAHGGSNPFSSANKKGTFVYQKFLRLSKNPVSIVETG